MPGRADGEEAEWRTRRERIDPRLRACGWEVVRFDASRPLSAYKRHAITEYETANGPADYALCVDGRILGIIEAKRVGLNPQERLPQAGRYSKGIKDSPFQCDGGYGAPFLYATNGELVWFHDVRHGDSRSRPIGGFHTPEALQEILATHFDAACQRLKALPNAHKMIRPYQVEANAATEKAIAERKRQMLLAMATGTGKTFTMVNQIYRLMKTGAAKRILFLVDRRALAAQAVRAFASFEAEPSQKFDQIYEVYSQRFQREDFEESEKFDPKVLPSSYLLTPKSGHAFVYVSTIQRMAINLFGKEAVFSAGDESPDEDAEKLDIPIHAFDLIVADECHRGYTSQELSVWRSTLDHFDAIKIGLTATPAAHTTAYFKEVVFRYEYERAVREGHLVDYDVVAIKSDVRMNGIFLEEGEQVGVVDTRTGQLKMDFLEDERQVDASEVERKATAPVSNRKILEEVKKHALAHQEKYGRFPKTLIFAVNDIPHTSHCDQLADIARDVFGQGDAFVQKITGTVDRPLQRIREFRNRPHVPITIGSWDGFDISLCFTEGYSRSSNEYRVWEKCLLWIESKASRRYGEFEDVAEWMRQFLALAMGRPIYPTRIRTRPQNPRRVIQEPPIYEELEIFWDFLIDDDGTKPLAPHEMLFRLEHIRHDPLAFTGRFFEKQRRLEPVCELYLSTLYNSRMYLPQRFLTLAQAVEGYHRIFVTPREYQSREVYTKGLRTRLLEAVPDDIGNDFKEAIQGKLGYLYEFTFKKRVQALHEKFAGTLRTYLGDDGQKFAKTIKDLRNKLTHPDASNDAVERSSSSSTDLWLKCEQLSLLLQVCLLDELGFDETAIQDMIRRGRHAQTILHHLQ